MTALTDVRMAVSDATGLPMRIVEFVVMPYICACVHDSSGRVSDHCAECTIDLTWFTRLYFTDDFRAMGMWCDHCFSGHHSFCTNNRVWRLINYPCCNARKSIHEYFYRPGLECVSCVEMWEGITFVDCSCACPPGTHLS